MGYELPSVPHRPHYSYSSNSNPRLLTLTLQAATGTHPPQPPTSHKRGDIGDLTLKDTPLQRLHYISMYISRLRLRLHRALKIQNSPLSPLLPGPLFREFKVSARDVVCRLSTGVEVSMEVSTGTWSLDERRAAEREQRKSPGKHEEYPIHSISLPYVSSLNV